MNLFLEILKFFIYSGIIVVIAKYLLVPVLRKLAESLNLNPKTVGNIAGLATSVPELLTVVFSALTGLMSASIYNILSSNIINLTQYTVAIYLNKNQRMLQNRALAIDLCIVAITIIIPIFLLAFNIEVELATVPLFILLFAFFYFINNHAHKLYLNKKTEQDIEIEKETKWVKGKKRVIVRYTIYLLIISIALFIAGNLLSRTLEKLCIQFKISEFIIGILLGVITSIPELITFFESQKHHNKKENRQDGVIEATNNLLTSNILNLFIIQSVGIIVFKIFS